MADSGGGGIGVLGVLVGALLVIVVGAGFLFASGHLGGSGPSSSVKIEMPKTTGAK
jgi:hypothetical protein